MLLSVRSVSKRFPVERGLWGEPTAFVRALEDVTLDVAEGEIVGVVGESGCGKTTLGRCVAGLYEPSSGKVFWDGTDVGSMSPGVKREARRHFQLVFQNPFASLNPRQKVAAILEEPLVVQGVGNAGLRRESARALLEKVGLSASDLEKYPHEFSGGQRQRVGLARALSCDPRLMVLDEPVSSLDVSVQAAILNLLADLNRERKISYLFISHDLQVVGYLSRRILVMYLGRVVEEGETEAVLRGPRHPYTRALLAASRGEKAAVEGEPPSPIHPPEGCAFHTRCPFAEARCTREKQPLLEVGGGRKTACWKWEKL